MNNLREIFIDKKRKYILRNKKCTPEMKNWLDDISLDISLATFGGIPCGGRLQHHTYNIPEGLDSAMAFEKIKKRSSGLQNGCKLKILGFPQHIRVDIKLR